MVISPLVSIGNFLFGTSHLLNIEFTDYGLDPVIMGYNNDTKVFFGPFHGVTSGTPYMPPF